MVGLNKEGVGIKGLTLPIPFAGLDVANRQLALPHQRVKVGAKDGYAFATRALDIPNDRHKDQVTPDAQSGSTKASTLPSAKDPAPLGAQAARHKDSEH